jgi:hypothetical protein
MTELTAETLAQHLDDPLWRISNLYKIVIKGDNDDDDEGLVVQFRPNRAQRRLMARLHNRNIILKARQLGFSTLICILWLDTALFSKEPLRCGIIAQDREAAEALFRGKVLFAYDNLPEQLRAAMPLTKRTASEIEFGHNGSSIRVATSMRSGTIHRLHVSEYGKICAKYPDKAREVKTGSIPAVPNSGILVIESTAEGQEGDFYEKTQRAMALRQQGAKLSVKDYRLHFFAWWEAPEYAIDPEGVTITPVHHKYFNEVEAKIGREITLEQRAWYVSTLESDFSGEAPDMWQEYPSTPEESFQVSTEGCFYAEQLARVRKEGRIVKLLAPLPVQVNTFWDLGRGDMTAIWLHQRATQQDRFLHYYENSGEDLIHYVQKLQEVAAEKRLVYGTHYIPHDAEYKRLGERPDTNKSIKEMLESLWPGQRFEVVPRISTLQAGIQATRQAFPSAWFDEDGCADGLKRLGNYRKRWNKVLGCWSDQEQQDDNCHGADAFRQWAQEVANGNTFSGGGLPQAGAMFKRRGSPMAV